MSKILHLTDSEFEALCEARDFCVKVNSWLIVDGCFHRDLVDESRLNDIVCEIDGVFDSRHATN